MQIRLALETVLVKKTEFPKAAKKELGAVVAMFVKSVLPNAEKTFVWSHSIVSKSKINIQVKVWIFKKEALESITTAITQSGARVHSVSVNDPAFQVPFFDARRTVSRPLRYWYVATAVLFVAFALAFAWSETAWRKEKNGSIRALRAELTDLAGEAVQLRNEKSKASKDVATVQTDMEAIAIARSFYEDLFLLNTSLTDDTWLTEMRQTGSQLQITGFSHGSVSEVISNLQSEGAYTRADLIGRVSNDRSTQTTRFQIDLERPR
ncbi:MAG: PilN domain-containing protein [Litorimonas sp.]